MKEQTQKEIDHILQHTQLVRSYKEIEQIEHYPPNVKKLLKRIKRLKADHLLNQIL